MRKVLISLAVLLIAPAMFAATATVGAANNMTASVAQNCTIVSPTFGIAFGAYDPLVANESTGSDLDGSAAVLIRCTKKTDALIELSTSANASGTRRMINGAGEFLSYDLFKANDYAEEWGEGEPAAGKTGLRFISTSKDTPLGGATGFTVFGRIPKGQDANTGSYQDSVVLTVTF